MLKTEYILEWRDATLAHRPSYAVNVVYRVDAEMIARSFAGNGWLFYLTVITHNHISHTDIRFVSEKCEMWNSADGRFNPHS